MVGRDWRTEATGTLWNIKIQLHAYADDCFNGENQMCAKKAFIHLSKAENEI